MSAPPVRMLKTFQIGLDGQSRSPGDVLQRLNKERLEAATSSELAKLKSETLLSSNSVKFARMASVSWNFSASDKTDVGSARSWAAGATVVSSAAI